MVLCVSYLSICVMGVTMMLGLGVCCDGPQSLCGASAPGDIIFGILGSVHSKVKDLQLRLEPEMYTCTDFDLIPFVQSLAIIHAIEMINNSSFLPGIRLGYQMCDPCVYGTKALQCVQYMLAVNESLEVLPDNSNFHSPVKVFLGERYSELSIPVAKLLSLYMIPQISCTSSSPSLSDKLRYASFFRVIPSDVYQTRALAKLMRHFKWDWVGVVTIDDDYGKPALEKFLLDARQQQICVDFQEVVPNYLGFINIEQRIKEVADRIRSSSAKAVLLILRPEHVQMLFEEMIVTNTTRIWIASDAWSMARFVMNMDGINKVGDIFGFTFATGTIPGLEDYLQNLRPVPGVRNDFIREYKQMRFNCTSGQQSEHISPMACNVSDLQEANDDYLAHAVDLKVIYNQRVAVYAIAHGIKKLLKCNDTACTGDTNFHPWKLVQILHEINFTLDNLNYSFNENGDFENGYDLMMWKKNGDRRVPDVVGKFLIKNGDVEVYEHKLPWSNDTVPLSRCSEPCPPGTAKNVSNIACCYSCTNCIEGYYSEKWDQSSCQKCPDGSSSLSGSTKCQPIVFWYLEWSSAYSIVVMVGTVIGIVLMISSFIVFILHRGHTIIKGRLLCLCFMKLGLLVSFGSVITFLGRPNRQQCMAQQAMYGLGFTFCMACIFARAVQVFITYTARDPSTQHRLKRLDKPFVIIGILTVLQGLICVFWLIFDPINVEETESSSPIARNLLCTYGRMYGFGAMHVYIGLLALISFLLAFKGQDEPIVFSVLIHLFVWLCLIPVFLTQNELQPIVQISGIMVSNYGVIFCHFIPKCYRFLSKIAGNSTKTNPETILTSLQRPDSNSVTEITSYDPLSNSIEIHQTTSDSGISHALSLLDCMSAPSSTSHALHSRNSIAESESHRPDNDSVLRNEVSTLSILHQRRKSL